jgi:hypothetical protein
MKLLSLPLAFTARAAALSSTRRQEAVGQRHAVLTDHGGHLV